MQKAFKAFLGVALYFSSVWFQLYVAAVHLLCVYEEWTALLLLLPSEHTADSSMDTDWVSKETEPLLFLLTVYIFTLKLRLK